jgi:Fur family ferric uptake transcriptional regulator
MTATHAKLSLDEARAILRDAGMRCTPVRLRVLQHLAALQKPLSHSAVSAALAPEGFDKSTVFRCLVQLSEAELVSILDLGDQVRRFEWRAPENQPGHALAGHAITESLFKGHCRRCK